MNEIVNEFLAESYEAATRLDEDLKGLEGSPADAEALSAAFRAVHMVKGSCGFLGFSKLEELAAAGEVLLGGLRSTGGPLRSEAMAALADLATALRETLDAIKKEGNDHSVDFSSLAARLVELAEETAGQ